ncbi:MAG: hypothetical protein WCU88_04125 [Elusimicrobiota bacterium]|jgi:cytochrome c-type biogenesis protein CcmH/NrfG
MTVLFPVLVLWAPAAARASAAVPEIAEVRVSSASFVEEDRLYFHRQQSDNLERSIALLSERLRSQPEDAQILWRMGRCWVRAGERKKKNAERLADFLKAKGFLDRALAADAREAQAHFWWGIAAGREGQARGILRSLFLVSPIKEHMRRTIQLDPSHGGAHHVLGEMLRQIPGFAGGSKKKALAELREASRLWPNWTANYPALAQACLDVSDKACAAESLRAAFRVSVPDDPGEHDENIEDARRMLAELGEKSPY